MERTSNGATNTEVAGSGPTDDSRVIVFDTTLRDGEQSPGATMSSDEKLTVANALSSLGVDVMECGFPAASPDDLAAVKRIAEVVGQFPVQGRKVQEPPVICGLARAKQSDIDACWQAVQPATHPRIHTFIATSPIHRAHKLRMTREEVVERARTMVAYAKGLCGDIEFSCEDAARTEPEFLYEVLEAVIAAGATTVNIPDTVGYTTPDEMHALIAGIKRHVSVIDQAVISMHCHNDLGLATANTLAGLSAGARQVEVTINGIGERAGNTSLEEVVMALRTRRQRFGGLRTGVDTTQLTRASRLVSTITGMLVQPNKAIVGANAFAHEAGIHQDGMLKHESTYEIMRPETVGAAKTSLVLGKHSGRAALKARLGELGMPVEGDALDHAFKRFKEVADRKKVVSDLDLEAIVYADQSKPEHALYELAGLQVGSGTVGMPTATVRLKLPDGGTMVEAAVGTGPVDAMFLAIEKIVGLAAQGEVELLEYTVHSVTEGIDAMGEVSVRIRGADTTDVQNPQSGETYGRVFHGHGADTDILVASAKAYIAAVNRLLAARGARKGEPDHVMAGMGA